MLKTVRIITQWLHKKMQVMMRRKHNLYIFYNEGAAKDMTGFPDTSLKKSQNSRMIDSTNLELEMTFDAVAVNMVKQILCVLCMNTSMYVL